MNELTEKVVRLVETMRYPEGIEITMEKLVQKITLTSINTDGFMEEIEKEEETEELSESGNESINNVFNNRKRR